MIYMNNAATSFPKPPCVAQAMSQALSRQPGDSLRGGGGEDVFKKLRQELKPLLGVSDGSRIALGPNASWALNQAILGFELRPGDRVLSTKAEHNSVLRPLHRLRQQGVEVILTDTDSCGRIRPEQWQEAIIKYRPRLAVFSHASNVTGAVNDAACLCRQARSAGAAVLVDAAQTAGFIPVQAELWGADMLAFTGHKYLLGPQGTGGLWLSPAIRLRPLLTGGTGVKSDLPDMPEEMPVHLECGTGNEPSFAGLSAALKWQRENPLQRSEICALSDKIALGLRRLGARVIIPSGERTPVVSFSLPSVSVEETGYILRESCDIVCRSGLHCAPLIFSCLGMEQSVRLSLSRFNTEEEAEELLKSVEAII